MPAPRLSRLLRFLVSLCVPRDEREFLLGDLEESASRGRGDPDRLRRHHSSLREAAGVFQLVIGPHRKARRSSRRHRGDNMLQELVRDIRLGLRMMARSPGFTAVAVFTMALGIGANTAMFSVVNGVLLKPLPYPHAERIVYLMENNLSRGWTSFTIAPDNFRDWREQNRSMDLMAAYLPRTVTYTGGDEPRRLAVLQVSEEYLEILGGAPVLGRGFAAEDMDANREAVVLLSGGFWREAFGGDPGVLGRSVLFDGVPHTVIGVLPEGWGGPSTRGSVELLLPLRPQSWWGRGNHFLRSIARMRPGVTLDQARADFSAVTATLEAAYPETNTGWGASLWALDDALLGDARPQLLMLLVSVGLVLLIACANVAQMTLARGSTRGHEMAVRTALGAGRGRVVRQLLAESLVLSVVGGAVGVFLAVACLKGLLLGWPEILPRMGEIELNGTVLAFTAGLSLAAGLLFGLFPALSLAGSNVGEALRRSGWSVTGDASRRRLRAGLVVVEVSLAVILLVGSGLLIRSLVALRGENPGFETRGRLTLYTALPAADYPTAAEQRAYGDATLERIGSLPGVESAAITTLVPVGGRDEIWGLELEGRPARGPEDAISALLYRVSPGYFEMMGIAVRAGREFTRDDRDGTTLVAVVSESFAQTHFPEESPLGKRIRFGDLVEIVGVAGNVQHYQLGQTSLPQVYLPFAQWPDEDLNFVVKATVPPLSLVSAIRVEIRAVDPNMPLEGVRTLDQIVAADMSAPRFRTMLLSSFGLTALLLAVVGLYGVMSYTVARRSREIGMRMALGAERSAILMLVFRDGLPLVMAGVVVGLGGALAVTRVLRSMLFGVGAGDPAVFAAVPLLLLAVSAVAMLIPAVRATRVNPVKALTAE